MTDQFATEVGLLHVVTHDYLITRIAEAQDYFEWELAAAATDAYFDGDYDGFDHSLEFFFDKLENEEWEAAAQATDAYIKGYVDSLVAVLDVLDGVEK